MAWQARWGILEGVGSRLILACSVLILAGVSLSGCIDVELARDLFVQEAHERMVYVNKVYTYSYSFTTVMSEPSTVEFSEVFDISIKNDTTYLDTIVSVSIPALPDLGSEWQEILENFTMERYVKVEVFDPMGEKMRSILVNYTTVHPVQLARIPEPEYGNWKLKIEAQGIGISAIDLHDTFYVRMTAREPKYEVVD